MRDHQEWDPEIASGIIKTEAARPGAALPMLHALQARFGYIADDVIPDMARALNLTRAEVHGIVTFYHDFRHQPPGRHVLKLCRAEACQAMGGDGIAAAVMRRWDVEWGGTTADRAISLDAVYCLGLCACAPAAMLDGEPIGRISMDVIERALDGERP